MSEPMRKWEVDAIRRGVLVDVSHYTEEEAVRGMNVACLKLMKRGEWIIHESDL